MSAEEPGYVVSRLDDVEELDDGRSPWKPIRHHLGISAFGVSSWTGKATGDRIINEHDEANEQEELYLVLEGRARFELAGEVVDAPKGTLVFAKPGVQRTAFAEEDGTTLLAIGGTPGAAYEVLGFELWAPLRPLYEAGDYEGVIERGRAAIEAHPRYAQPFYNLACCESLVGRTDDALAHLRQAFELAPSVREWAKQDTDLDAIRDDSRFAEIMAG